ncbi:MAG: DUF4115 domain-containing protein [Cyanobacteria bacterium M_surface_10_m2_179]|nr:DUF4115 domain-containing protein [Cyanobacteria bacterium M_surface_10_m2_179]
MNASEASTPTPSDDSQRPLERLGSTLQQAREARGLDVASLAKQLRMGEEQLLALESGDRARLPELVFVIAQARRVATALSCDIDALITPLKKESSSPFKATPAPLSSVPSPSRERRAARISAQSYTHQPARSSRQGALRWLGSLALLAGVIAAGSWGWQLRSQLQQLVSARSAPPTAKPKPAATQPKPKRPKPAAAAAVPATSLKLSSKQASWLEVRNGSGKQLFEGNFKGERSFPLQGGLQVLAGRPDLVQVSFGAQPARPLGPIDQIRWVSFKAPAR